MAEGQRQAWTLAHMLERKDVIELGKKIDKNYTDEN